MKALLVVAMLGFGFTACATSTAEVEVSVDESEARLKCPEGPGVVYYATDPAVCANILWSCGDGTAFNNECGCGCIPPPCTRYCDSICADAPPEGTCLSDPGVAACFDSATCERQPDGVCGWNWTRRLDRCLASL